MEKPIEDTTDAQIERMKSKMDRLQRRLDDLEDEHAKLKSRVRHIKRLQDMGSQHV